MARGAQKTGENLAQQGVASANQFNTQQEQQNQALNNYLVPQYQQMLQNPGYTPAQKAAITLNSEGSVASSFGGSQDQLARSAARTGNTASATAGADAMAQQKANTMSQVAASNETNFANDAQKQQEQALQGLSGLYGVNTNLLAKSLGLPVEYLQQYNNAANQKGQGQIGWSNTGGLSLSGGL